MEMGMACETNPKHPRLSNPTRNTLTERKENHVVYISPRDWSVFFVSVFSFSASGKAMT